MILRIFWVHCRSKIQKCQLLMIPIKIYSNSLKLLQSLKFCYRIFACFGFGQVCTRGSLRWLKMSGMTSGIRNDVGNTKWKAISSMSANTSTVRLLQTISRAITRWGLFLMKQILLILYSNNDKNRCLNHSWWIINRPHSLWDRQKRIDVRLACVSSIQQSLRILRCEYFS